MTRRPTQFRLPEETLSKLDELGEKWGGIEPASRTACVVRSIDLAHAAEFGAPKPKAGPRKAPKGGA